MPVSHSKNPFKVNVGFLLNQQTGVSRDIHFDFPEFLLPPDLNLTDMVGVIRLSRATQGLLVQADFIGKVQAQCVRCLVDFLQPLHASFSEVYSFKGKPISDSGLEVPDDANIDFTPLVWEYMTLEIPINALCKPDCKGLCVECGENLNERICEHQLSVTS
jgi:uncharacterized protein